MPPSNIQAQRDLVDGWLAKNKTDFAAHAVWKGNFSKIVQEGAVLPAEAILRKKQEVEYEAGSTYNARGTLTLPKLSEEELRSIEVLDSDESKKIYEVFYFLAQKDALTPEEHKELKHLDLDAMNVNEYDYQWDSFQRDLFQKAENDVKSVDTQKQTFDFRMKYIKRLPEDKQKRYEELAGKEWLPPVFYQYYKSLQLSLRGISVIFEKKRMNPWHFKIEACVSMNHPRIKAVQTLARKYNTKEGAIEVAYYTQRENYIDQFLARKYERWTKGKWNSKIIFDALLQARQIVCWEIKLNPEIRTSKNAISWSYGNTVILRGKTKDIQSSPARDGQELLLLEPWQNKGSFFSLPLAQEDTLVIGPQKELEPHLEKFQRTNVQYAFTESLSVEQNKIFKTPQDLRDPNEPVEKPPETPVIEKAVKNIENATSPIEVVSEKKLQDTKPTEKKAPENKIAVKEGSAKAPEKTLPSKAKSPIAEPKTVIITKSPKKLVLEAKQNVPSKPSAFQRMFRGFLNICKAPFNAIAFIFSKLGIWKK